MYDVIIVGGGPAGLSAALVLVRSRRRVLLYDTGKPRNARSLGMHGYLTRDGILPHQFLELARAELGTYGVEIRHDRVVSACGSDLDFTVVPEQGEAARARKLLIATGLVDLLPPVEGIDQFYGTAVHHCPYCDGWEIRDLPVAVMGRRKAAVALSVSLTTWTPDVSFLMNSEGKLDSRSQGFLDEHGVCVVPGKVERLEGTAGKLERIRLTNRPALEVRALFISYGYEQHSDLARQLGCAFTSKGVARTNKFQYAGSPGVYVAGDASKDMQMVIVAAAEGAKAGAAINMALQEQR